MGNAIGKLTFAAMLAAPALVHVSNGLHLMAHGEKNGRNAAGDTAANDADSHAGYAEAARISMVTGTEGIPHAPPTPAQMKARGIAWLDNKLVPVDDARLSKRDDVDYIDESNPDGFAGPVYIENFNDEVAETMQLEGQLSLEEEARLATEYYIFEWLRSPEHAAFVAEGEKIVSHRERETRLREREAEEIVRWNRRYLQIRRANGEYDGKQPSA